MKPFAVFQATAYDDGDFSTFNPPPARRFRQRVELWIETTTGERLTDNYSTKKPCSFSEFLEQTIKPAVDELIAEARDLGGTEKYGFSCYLWG